MAAIGASDANRLWGTTDRLCPDNPREYRIPRGLFLLPCYHRHALWKGGAMRTAGPDEVAGRPVRPRTCVALPGVLGGDPYNMPECEPVLADPSSEAVIAWKQLRNTAQSARAEYGTAEWPRAPGVDFLYQPERVMGIGPRKPAPASDDPITHADFEHALGMVLDQLAELRSDQPKAIAGAIRDVLTDVETWNRVIDTASQAAGAKATTAAGRGFLWLLRNAFGKAVFISLVVVVTAKMFGWDVAAKVGKWLSGSSG